MLFGLLFSAGMWGSSVGGLYLLHRCSTLTSVAFLPSTFAMYTTMLASSYSFHPATSAPTGVARAYKATACVALGAMVGWPFSAALGVPFVVEQLFLNGGDVAVGTERTALRNKRWETLLKAIAVGASLAVSLACIHLCTLTWADPRVHSRLLGIWPLDFPYTQYPVIQYSLPIWWT